MERPYRHILVSRDADLGVVTMNRPERRNALSEAHLLELTDALRSLADREDVRAIVLAAAGPVYSSGHDFADMAERGLDGMRTLFAVCEEFMLTIQRVPQPVVARVHGLATAAGCQLVASCDLAVAAEEAAFAAPGGKGGWFCHTPMVAIARNIGRKRAAELAFTGDTISARQALDWGLVNAVAPAGRLDEAVHDLLTRATRGSAASKGIGKTTLYAQSDLGQADAYNLAIEVMAATSQTPDAQEGMAAFLEKRPPRWAH